MLEALLRDHLRSTKTFSDGSHMNITTEKGFKYRLHGITDSTVNILGTCTKLTLLQCKNIKIVADKLPIMGIEIMHSDNVTMDITASNGAGYVVIDHSVLLKLEINQECTVDVNECMNVLLNDCNISDLYIDSTWHLS